MPKRGASISEPMNLMRSLTLALAHATLNQQRTMLGETPYQLVEKLEPDAAAKVTGMLLEMDQGEILHCIQSPKALKSKVAEAMEVLTTVADQQQQTGGASS